jgi:hypothetical protein
VKKDAGYFVESKTLHFKKANPFKKLIYVPTPGRLGDKIRP